MKTKPLTVQIKDGELIMRVGIDTLAHAAEYGEMFNEFKPYPACYPPYVKVKKKSLLAKDVKTELLRNDEDGSTPLSRLLDQMLVEAREDGSLAFEDMGR